ncbi:hypothetical protein [Planctomycetes bacterium TBK1r]|uniref:Uncharacterized protein n=1 Tax=Stieleria magnilauensis TaxID=2527963 RepID=A0ABX5XUL7_9BACT|nr:hypothetical protein TBK1r_44950 [Planctomycetes bacterium TBK1r]
MKSIEASVSELIQRSRRTSESHDRDTKLILDYYGFLSDTLATQEQLGNQYSAGTRQNVNQIIDKTFRTHVAAKRITGIVGASELIAAKQISTWSDIRHALTRTELISDSYHPASLMRLLNELGYCEDFELLTPIAAL